MNDYTRGKIDGLLDAAGIADAIYSTVTGTMIRWQAERLGAPGQAETLIPNPHRFIGRIGSDACIVCDEFKDHANHLREESLAEWAQRNGVASSSPDKLVLNDQSKEERTDRDV